MTSGLGHGIDKALKDIEDESAAPSELIEWDDPEVCRFIAHVKSVEGRKVVVLERATNGSVRGEAL